MIFLEVVDFSVYDDEEVVAAGKTFKWPVKKCGVLREKYETITMKKVFSDMLHKLLCQYIKNSMINGYNTIIDS